MHEFTLDGMHAVAALEQQGQSALAEFEVLDAAMDRVRMANDGTSAQQIGNDDADGLRRQQCKPGDVSVRMARIGPQHRHHRELRWSDLKVGQGALDPTPIGVGGLAQEIAEIAVLSPLALSTMTQSLFLAGASGVIGRRLTPLLVAEGWRVFGMTRSADKASRVKDLGAEAIVADVFDATAVASALSKARPDVVIHQLTDLPPGLDSNKMAETTPRNARIRHEGTRNLLSAAVSCGVRRFVAQSIAYAYADGPLPHWEEGPLNVDAEGQAGISARGVASLEHQVLSAPLVGIVLRYGRFYGPGTGFETARAPGTVHVDAAAHAAALAAVRGAPGIYNIAEDDGAVSSEKAKRLFGWSAGWRPLS